MSGFWSMYRSISPRILGSKIRSEFMTRWYGSQSGVARTRRRAVLWPVPYPWLGRGM